jgi:hypothetical protein
MVLNMEDDTDAADEDVVELPEEVFDISPVVPARVSLR